jgi:hypothetical protein
LRITVLDLYALVYEISLTIWFLFSGPWYYWSYQHDIR